MKMNKYYICFLFISIYDNIQNGKDSQYPLLSIVTLFLFLLYIVRRVSSGE